MENNQEPVPESSPSRRKFVWGLGILSLFATVGAAAKFPFSGIKRLAGSKPKCKNTTIKMLTQDGRIVEIDATFIASNSKKISNTELQNWMKK